ncbi:putative germin-like protein 2-1 [Acorus gramineus]|uniref:Germin-like protein 2-1 n=1 Tax=Acorus gramineus TaxID=55184 RepID=A0AAV9BVB0_ACOGR|nr:putative germin-like protein 2-1 [Acorus gramineus]
MARMDYAPYRITPPHTHPRATEILTVLEGTLYVGFVTSNPENRHTTKVLKRVMSLSSLKASFISNAMLVMARQWQLQP